MWNKTAWCIFHSYFGVLQRHASKNVLRVRLNPFWKTKRFQNNNNKINLHQSGMNKLCFRARTTTVIANESISYSFVCPTSLVLLCPLHAFRVLFLLDGSSVKSNDDPTDSSRSFPGSLESWRRSLHSSSCNDRSEEPSRCIAGTSQSFTAQAQFSLFRMDSVDVLRVFAKSRASPEGSSVDLHSRFKNFF